MNKVKNTEINALVVDDNEVNAMILTNMLELFKIHVNQAYQGMEAVRLSKKKTYDIIFIDHIMPDMDGIQTITAIHNLSTYKQKSVIIALTSDCSEQINNRYIEAGARELFVKPLSLLDLVSLLKKWCPKVQFDIIYAGQEQTSRNKNNEYISSIIDNIEEIDYSEGLKYAIGDSERFMKILEVSLKDLQTCISIMINSHENNSMKQLYRGVHKLKSICFNIGAIRIIENIKTFEKIILDEDRNKINGYYNQFIEELEQFTKRLSEALRNYFDLVRTTVKEQEPVLAPMTNDEYEHCLLCTIYYIRRYEYDSIVKELEHLILKGNPDFKLETKLVLKNIKDFNYEKALDLMIKIKNKTGNLPIPEFQYSTKLNNYID